ncbi:MAG: LysR family transcriptional regulator [Deltaproteobacteria bacterium]|nr:LysR family transcriptional regulator [Deltaproteobacteria bacterium]
MFDELNHFLLIVEHGTFTEASRRAHLSQPALSASIKRLEERLGGRLLHRGAGGARPTAAGQALIPKAELALAAVADGRRAVSEVLGLRTGEVRLGAGPTVATYMLPATMAAFRVAHPGVRLYLREAHSPAVWEGLRRGDLDLGVVTGSSVDARESWVVAEDWRQDELVVASAPGDPAPNAWVCFPRGSMLRHLLDEGFDAPDVVMELGSIAAVKGNVRAGVGRCLISRSAIERDLADGQMRLVHAPPAPIVRTMTLVHRGADRLPPAAARLREMLLGPPA